jgi:hypothetical protein
LNKFAITIKNEVQNSAMFTNTNRGCQERTWYASVENNVDACPYCLVLTVSERSKTKQSKMCIPERKLD